MDIRRDGTLALRAQDIQTGLQDVQVPEFDKLLLVGMAARLAVCIREKTSVELQSLRQLAVYAFGVPSIAVDSVLRILQEAEFIEVVEKPVNEARVIPTVPYYEDLYETLSDATAAHGLNELEQASIIVLDRLSRGPLMRDELARELGLDNSRFDAVMDIGADGSYITATQMRDGSYVLTSPVYFSENPGDLVNVVELHGAGPTGDVLNAVRNNQGWPLEKAIEASSIGDEAIGVEHTQALKELVVCGILQPPTVSTTDGGMHHFLFLPAPGSERIHVVEKDIYEKAMAVVSAVRHGEHYATYRIASPTAVVRSLLDRGYIRSNTMAREQWRPVVLHGICKLHDSGGGFHEVHLIRTLENERAVRLALELLVHKDVKSGRGLTEETRRLDGGALYGEALRGYRTARGKLARTRGGKRAQEDIERLLGSLWKY